MGEDPKEVEGDSAGVLRGTLTKATGSATEGKDSSGSSSNLVALVLAAISVLGLAVMGFFLVRAKRKAAKLASELRKKEEKHAQAEEDLKLADSTTKRAVAEQKKVELGRDIETLTAKLKTVVEKNAERRKVFAELSDWDDLTVVDRRDKPIE